MLVLRLPVTKNATFLLLFLVNRRYLTNRREKRKLFICKKFSMPIIWVIWPVGSFLSKKVCPLIYKSVFTSVNENIAEFTFYLFFSFWLQFSSLLYHKKDDDIIQNVQQPINLHNLKHEFVPSSGPVFFNFCFKSI